MFEQHGRIARDRGFSSLGLLMQLGGGVLAAAVPVFVLGVILDDQRHDASVGTGWLVLLMLASVARSLVHRDAGTSLLYGDPTKPRRLRGVHLYIAVGLAHAVLAGGVFTAGLHAPIRSALAAAAALAVWPICLAIVCALPAFRSASKELAATEDKGFEGAAILMTVFGVCGIVATLVLLFALVDHGDTARGVSVLGALVLIMLLVRSFLHVEAGVVGLRETSADRAIELVKRYAKFGLISSCCGAGAMLLVFVSLRATVPGLAIACALCWVLMAWPLTIRRFVADRQFAELMAGDDAPIHHRAPDAGLTGLGWLLVGHAAIQAALLLPQLVGGESDLAAMLTNIGARSLWFPVGAMILQGWAGFELVRMSPQSRGVATVYGLVAAATTIFINYPVLRHLQRGAYIESNMDALAVGAMIVALVLPIATLVLVHRTIAPTARARFRTKPRVQANA